MPLGNCRSSEGEGRQYDERHQVVQCRQPDGIEPAELPQREDDAGEEEAGGQAPGHRVDRHAPRFEVHDDADAQHRAGHHQPIAPHGPLPKHEHANQQHPHGRRALQPNRVGRRAFDHRREIGVVHAGEEDRHRHEPPRPARPANERPQRDARKRGPPKRDLRPRPTGEIRRLDEETTRAPQHRRDDHQQAGLINGGRRRVESRSADERSTGSGCSG